MNTSGFKESLEQKPAGGDVREWQYYTRLTIEDYGRLSRQFWEGTRDHDVSQNYAALFDAIEAVPPYSILDLGCGPGRDLAYFQRCRVLRYEKP